ncbi:MAG: DUF1003 domain-containing protein [Gammaproteobacteria bacterium]|nr:DUF1003 domain-containing protein [Gammaproteobacteria bacterium]
MDAAEPRNSWGRCCAFDPYPFIFLNLLLSMLAAIRAPVIMMSQNRAAGRDRLAAEVDHEVNVRAELAVRDIDRRLRHLESHMDAMARNGFPPTSTAGEQLQLSARLPPPQPTTPHRLPPHSRPVAGTGCALRTFWPCVALTLAGWLGWRELSGLDLTHCMVSPRSERPRSDRPASAGGAGGARHVRLRPAAGPLARDRSAEPAGAALRLAGLHAGQLWSGCPAWPAAACITSPCPARASADAPHRDLCRSTAAGGPRLGSADCAP